MHGRKMKDKGFTMKDSWVSMAFGICLLVFITIFVLYVDVDMIEDLVVVDEIYKGIVDCIAPDWGADGAVACNIEARP